MQRVSDATRRADERVLIALTTRVAALEAELARMKGAAAQYSEDAKTALACGMGCDSRLAKLEQPYTYRSSLEQPAVTTGD